MNQFENILLVNLVKRVLLWVGVHHRGRRCTKVKMGVSPLWIIGGVSDVGLSGLHGSDLVRFSGPSPDQIPDEERN